MRIADEMRSEMGYTLLETVVAMALFLSVLIPLGITIGNLTLDNSASRMNSAFQIAQSEMCQTVLKKNFQSEKKNSNPGFVLEKTIKRDGRLVDVTISVYQAKKPETKVLTISKSLLDYP
jgi:type II secretory pathway component PulJ